jgi:hypothetical protein
MEAMPIHKFQLSLFGHFELTGQNASYRRQRWLGVRSRNSNTKR